MAEGDKSEAPVYEDHFSSYKLRRTASLPNIKVLLEKRPADTTGLAGSAETSDNSATNGDAESDADLLVTAALGGRDLASLNNQDLKAELAKRGLSKKGKKADLAHRLKTSILDKAESSSRQNPKVNNGGNQGLLTVDPEIIEVSGKSYSNTQNRCPCYEHFKSSIEKLSSEIAELKDKHTGNQPSHHTGHGSAIPSPVERLKEENAMLRSQLSSMKEKYDRVLEERDSLNLAIKIISKDLYHANPTQTKTPSPVPVNISQGYENPTLYKSPASQKKPTATAKKTGEKRNKKKAKKPVAEPNHENNPRKPVTVICGDSIIQHVRGWSLSQATESNKVVVKSFPGATSEDMEDYLKPVLRKEPQHIIIHVGTNDLRSTGAKRTAESIVNLGVQIEEDSPNTSVTISALLKRADDEDQSITNANKLLKHSCRHHKWNFIEHDNITCKHLNRGGLHLSKEGSTLLAQNFITHIRGD